MKPTIEVLVWALRKMHHPLVVEDGGARVVVCEHCADGGLAAAPTGAWPCPTIELTGRVLRGEA